MKCFLCLEDKKHTFWIENKAEETMEGSPLSTIGDIGLSCPWCDSLCEKVATVSDVKRLH